MQTSWAYKRLKEAPDTAEIQNDDGQLEIEKWLRKFAAYFMRKFDSLGEVYRYVKLRIGKNQKSDILCVQRELEETKRAKEEMENAYEQAEEMNAQLRNSIIELQNLITSQKPGDEQREPEPSTNTESLELELSTLKEVLLKFTTKTEIILRQKKLYKQKYADVLLIARNRKTCYESESTAFTELKRKLESLLNTVGINLNDSRDIGTAVQILTERLQFVEMSLCSQKKKVSVLKSIGRALREELRQKRQVPTLTDAATSPI